MAGIFISYRRADSAGYVGRLCDDLTEHFAPTPIFRDIDSIDPGLDFADQIGQAVGSCDVLLAVIGPAWLTSAKKDGQPRLADPHDYVRREIEEALSRKVRVIPVLVGGASMPSEDELPSELNAFARRNALELSDTRWEYDVGPSPQLAQEGSGPRSGERNQPVRWQRANGRCAEITNAGRQPNEERPPALKGRRYI